MTDHLTPDERRELGRATRRATPRTSHAEWSPDPDRPDPVGLLEAQNAARLPWLVPLRHARMGVSPFTFFRGAARIMASDLASSPTSGIEVQLGGDAHLSNFGAYASPERQLVFDQNDFDETLPGPWEWDLKRLAASFMVAGQSRGFSAARCRRITAAVTRSYRDAMARFAAMGFLELGYDHVTVDDVRRNSGLDADQVTMRLDRFERRARSKTSLKALAKLTDRVDGHYRIRSDPPVLFPLRDLPAGYDAPALEQVAAEAFEAYKSTLEDHRHALLDRYELVDVGVKVVGVGSVGTRCLVLFLIGRDENDPLFLQAKEAGASVLEDHLPPTRYDNHGRRVVEGQRAIQAQTDIFLGWTAGATGERHFYLRQLRDWKGSAEIEEATPDQLSFYAELCGLTLARGHARSGDSEAIRAYAGRSDTLDRSITEFAERYARQNLEDYERFTQAITDGRLESAETLAP
jgi:uncharacterized protein (DUF2252 family)